MRLIVGLGNPGEKYASTRHNVGFMVVNRLAERLGGLNFQAVKNGEAAKAQIHDDSAIILKPTTFMNLSGGAVQPAMAYYKIKPEQIVVIHDDLDIPFGQIRLKQGGGHGGHNGLRDIINRLGPDFVRLRMGIGRPQTKGTEHAYVLNAYAKSEIADLAHQIDDAVDAIDILISKGLSEAQQKHHSK